MKPRLIVLTGASHAGKSTVAEIAQQMLSRPSARVSIDPIVESLALPADDIWEKGLPVAYDVALAQTAVLLGHAFDVFFESTFTFVPLDGRMAELHVGQLDRLRAAARETGAQLLIVQFRADIDELLRRRVATGRLWDAVVEGTAQLHQQLLSVGGVTLELDTTALAPADAAARLVAMLEAAGAPAHAT